VPQFLHINHVKSCTGICGQLRDLRWHMDSLEKVYLIRLDDKLLKISVYDLISLVIV
jgi:hypothetical protein